MSFAGWRRPRAGVPVARRMLSIIAVAVLMAGCAQGRSPRAWGPADEPKVGAASVPTVLVIDGSGSMTTDDAPGRRIDAAKSAAMTLIDGLPDGAELALMTYGTSTGSAEADKAAGCRDVSVLVPRGALQRDRMRSAIAGIAPSGYTPLSLALQQAAGQLPADDSAQAVVLVSDGEDTCDVPPCETAQQLKKQRPGLAISTVGFRIDGAAAEQLSCIAQVTGGLFVTAENAAQLTARLLATQDPNRARGALTGKGLAGVALGQHIDDIRRVHPDFSEVASTGTVTVRWRDCQWTFTDGRLTEIAPDNARTIDGVAVGDPLSRAVEFYGKPLEVRFEGDAVYTVIVAADRNSDAAYRMRVKESDSAARQGQVSASAAITEIVLCLCKPHDDPAAETGSGEPQIVVLEPVDARGAIQPGWVEQRQGRTEPIDCHGHSPYDVGTGVRFCGGTADSADACWPTAGGRDVLCLHDPFSKALDRIPAVGAGNPKYPRSGELQPMALVLDGGAKCRVRIGGAWSAQVEHPDWVGFYSCDGPRWNAVYGPSGGIGIDKGPDGWTVWSGPSDGPLKRLRVVTAYYVGVA